MYDFIGLAKSAFDVAGNWLGWQREKDQRINAPEIKENVEAINDKKKMDQFTADVEKAKKTGDLDEIRKAAS
jgi:hypothetical protein